MSPPDIPPPPPPIATPHPDPNMMRIKAEEEIAATPGGASRLANNLGVRPLHNYTRAPTRTGATIITG